MKDGEKQRVERGGRGCFNFIDYFIIFAAGSFQL